MEPSQLSAVYNSVPGSAGVPPAKSSLEDKSPLADRCAFTLLSQTAGGTPALPGAQQALEHCAWRAAATSDFSSSSVC